jgi:uncharacterized protein
MPEVTKYPAGTPSWVDLGSPDPDASASFYGDLFGWTIVEAGPVEETGGYRMCHLRDKIVAGLGPLMGEGQRPSWTTYVSVDDADKTAARVTEAGGQVLVEPMDVMAAGRMAVFVDPTGAMFSIWQPGETIGAQLVNEPGTLCWNELATRDAETAKSFYSHVFDWTWQRMDGDGPEYWMFEVSSRVSGGLMPMVGDMWPADLPSHWMTYFAVDDADVSAARVTELGGSVIVPPTDIPPGRFAVVNDPHGAAFSILKLKQADPAP